MEEVPPAFQDEVDQDMAKAEGASGHDRRSVLNVIVSPGFQLRYLLFAGTIASTCSLALYFLFLFRTLDLIASPNQFLSTQRAIDVYDEIRNWGFMVLGLTVLLTVVSLVANLRQSHRIAGPLQRIDRFLDDLLKGANAGRLHLRDHDEFRDIADKLNAIADRIQEPEDSPLEVTRV